MSGIEIVEGVKLLGFLLVVVATFISTVIIPKRDKEITERKEKIERFDYSRIMTAMCKLDYGEHFTKRRIELLERNQMIIHGVDNAKIKELNRRLLYDTVQLAISWGSLLGREESENIKNRVDEIVSNKKMSYVSRIDEVEKVWRENQEAVSKKLEESHVRNTENKTLKSEYETSKLLWSKCFVWLQILGLILFSGAEIIGKLF